MDYIEHSLILISTITGCVFISTFASLVGISIGITSFAIGVKICVIAARNKKYKSINKKKRKKPDKIVLSYCLKCTKNTESKNLKIVRTKNGAIML